MTPESALLMLLGELRAQIQQQQARIAELQAEVERLRAPSP